jgi:hypothetical protein
MPVTAMSLPPQTPDFRCRQFPAAAALDDGLWLLIIASIAIAVYSANTVPGQRGSVHAANWLFRLVIGDVGCRPCRSVVYPKALWIVLRGVVN